jgi:hypothetical protein
MKKVLIIISLVLVVTIIGYVAYANRNSNSAYSYHHSDTFSPLDKDEDSSANTDSNEHTVNNTPDKNGDTVQEAEDKPETIVSTPIEDYDITGYKGDVDFNSLKYKKYKISNDTENGYQDWMFDYTSGDTVTIDLIVRLYNTYVENFGKPKTFNISDKKLDEYYGNAGYYIFKIDGIDYCFLYGEDMEYVYIYKV